MTDDRRATDDAAVQAVVQAIRGELRPPWSGWTRRAASAAIAAYERARGPQGEDHEAGIEAARQVVRSWPVKLSENAAVEVVDAYLSRVSAPPPDRATVELRQGPTCHRCGNSWAARDQAERARDEALARVRELEEALQKIATQGLGHWDNERKRMVDDNNEPWRHWAHRASEALRAPDDQHPPQSHRNAR